MTTKNPEKFLPGSRVLPSTLAKALSQLGAAKGGDARAKALSPERRSEIARAAVEARWEKAGKIVKRIPKATHIGTLKFGDLEIPCAVLEDGTRVLSQRGVTQALAGTRTASGGHYERIRENIGDAPLPPFLSANNLKPHIDLDLAATLRQPKEYLPEHGGRSAYGLEATLIPRVCDVWLKARSAGHLKPGQQHIAAKAEIMIRSLAHVGIIALVDEATGYQYERPMRDLEGQLRKFLAEDLARYASGFPSEYLKQLCRLRHVELRPDMKLPQYFGTLTGDLVYKRIAPGLLTALKSRRAERGKKSNKLYQWTSQEVGFPALMMQLGTVIGLMKIHTDYGAFKKQLDTVTPKYPDVPGLFDKSEDWEVPSK